MPSVFYHCGFGHYDEEDWNERIMHHQDQAQPQQEETPVTIIITIIIIIILIRRGLKFERL